MAGSYATVADARDHGITTAEATDAQLTTWLEVASRVVDDYTGTSFNETGASTRTYRGLTTNRLTLPYPSTNITAITVDGVTIAASSYTVADYDVRLWAHLTGRSTVVVTGTFGYPDVPSQVRKATLFIAHNLIRASAQRPAVGTDTEGNPSALPTAAFIPLSNLGEKSTGSLHADRLLRRFNFRVPAG